MFDTLCVLDVMMVRAGGTLKSLGLTASRLWHDDLQQIKTPIQYVPARIKIIIDPLSHDVHLSSLGTLVC